MAKQGKKCIGWVAGGEDAVFKWAKSAERLLQIHTGNGDSCSGQDCVWKNTPLPLPVFDEVDCKKVAKSSHTQKKTGRKVLFCPSVLFPAQQWSKVWFCIKETGRCQVHKPMSISSPLMHVCFNVLKKILVNSWWKAHCPTTSFPRLHLSRVQSCAARSRLGEPRFPSEASRSCCFVRVVIFLS